MHIYKDLDLVEQLGSGIPRILESYPKECFKFLDNFLRISLPINNDYVVEEGVNIGGAIGSAISDLTDRQNEVLTIIKADKTISYRAIAAQLNINKSAVLKHIDILKTKGYITRKGGTRGHWQIMK